jgi:hypothetical protein
MRARFMASPCTDEFTVSCEIRGNGTDGVEHCRLTLHSERFYAIALKKCNQFDSNWIIQSDIDHANTILLHCSQELQWVVTFEANSRSIESADKGFGRCSRGFAECASLQIRLCEDNSNFSQIGLEAFSASRALRSFCIHPLVDTVQPDIFGNSRTCEIQVAEGNRHFQVTGNFLLSFDGRFLIYYFPGDSRIRTYRPPYSI